MFKESFKKLNFFNNNNYNKFTSRQDKDPKIYKKVVPSVYF